MPFDWRQFHASNHPEPIVVDPHRRLRICLGFFAILLMIIFTRTIQLEWTQGAGFRAESLRPIEKKTLLPASRGKILARDGTILAQDKTVQAVAVEYRWFQEPPDARWLRQKVRARLNKADRKNAEKLAQAKAEFLAERDQLHKRLAELCGLTSEAWTTETRRIQSRVERIAAGANERRQTEDALDESDTSWAAQLRRLLLDASPSPRIIVAEELEPHILAVAPPPKAIAEITSHAEQYPGVKIVAQILREYPAHTLAAHVVGHLGRINETELAAQASNYLPDDLVGRFGIERQCEAVLQGHRGIAIEQTDRSGHVITNYHAVEPIPGGDVRLTIDPALQRTAESLLADAIERRTIADAAVDGAGGAIVAIDIRTGAVRAAASMPSFDPNIFIRGKSDEITQLLNDHGHPLLNRVCSMAIPPGSTFKTLTAIALLESNTVDPEQTFDCQGFLHRPDQLRCELFVRQGIGHGSVTLSDALTESCNVYFFHYAGKMGGRPLMDWTGRFGFGRPTGIDLSGESSGTPHQDESAALLAANRATPFIQMAVGQGKVTATPLQVVRMMAAVANGGTLVTPHVVEDGETRQALHFEEIRLAPRTLRVVRDGLSRVVSDDKGTAHETVYIESLAIAGKTGTAETGDGRPSHAWFAGYAPADSPRIAFVVVLEHAGEASVAAGPPAKRLVMRMEQLGLL